MGHAGTSLGVAVLLAVTGPASAEPLGIVGAVRSALERNPALRSQRELVDAAHGRVLSARGDFDWHIDTSFGHDRGYAPLPGQLVMSAADTTNLSLEVSKRFGWGTVVTPQVQLVRTGADSVAGASAPARNLARVTFQVVQPLLRGAGSGASSTLDAATYEYEASKQDYLHAVTVRILLVASAYWSYRATSRSRAIQQDAENRAKKLLDEFRALVEAGERPASDLGQLEANHADQSRARFAAQQALAEARYGLGLQMGLSYEQASALGEPATKVPAIAASGSVQPAAASAFTAQARSNRRDLAAAAERILAAAAQYAGADNGRLVGLDLLADLGYTGVEDGDAVRDYLAGLGNNVSGVDFNVGLRLRWPLGNDAAEGVAAVARAVHRQAVLARDEVVQEVEAGVATAASAVRLGAAALERARAAAVRYRESVENERRKLQAGLSTLIDVIVTEDRLTAALLSQNAQETEYARALVRLRYETGTLAHLEGDRGRIEEARMLSIPGQEEK